MATSSLLGGRRTKPEAKGRDLSVLGPSDSSDSGSDMAGLEAAPGGDPTLPVDVALRNDAPPLPGSESLHSASDAAGTGERRSAAADAGAAQAADIGVDRVFVPGGDAQRARRAPDDEDPDLAFIDDIQAADLRADEDAPDDADKDEEPAADGPPVGSEPTGRARASRARRRSGAGQP